MGQESSTLVDDDTSPQTLTSRTLPAIASLISSGAAKNIVVLTGAGISTSAGIPDFRSPTTGLYANLARLDLPYPEAVFDISFFRENPLPFYTLARELYPGKYRPTVAHAFIALLARKGLLKMLFTQNIDCLEREAGVPGDLVVEAHGSFATQRCVECQTTYPDEKMRAVVEGHEGAEAVPHCVNEQCGGLVKPDITFFGEALPSRFHDMRHVAEEGDLMLIMGTSLQVQPFASLPQMAAEGVPRLLFNLERVGGLGSRADDVVLLEDCDGGVRKLADELGWRAELEDLWKEVGPRRAHGEKGEEASQAETRTKDEVLEAEIEKLTGEVDETLKISNEHTKWVQEQLSAERTKATGKEAGSLDSKHTAPAADATASGDSPTLEEEQKAPATTSETSETTVTKEHETSAEAEASKSSNAIATKGEQSNL